MRKLFIFCKSVVSYSLESFFIPENGDFIVDYNTAEALGKLELRGPSSPQITNGHDAKWSEDECRNFEAGVRSFGKDFLQIQQNKVNN